jgi:surface polysaccharide O-acyltransferase-like enzyme
MKERIGYFDFLRGIAILVVIGIHSYYVVPFDSAINVMSKHPTPF